MAWNVAQGGARLRAGSSITAQPHARSGLQRTRSLGTSARRSGTPAKRLASLALALACCALCLAHMASASRALRATAVQQQAGTINPLAGVPTSSPFSDQVALSALTKAVAASAAQYIQQQPQASELSPLSQPAATTTTIPGGSTITVPPSVLQQQQSAAPSAQPLSQPASQPQYIYDPATQQYKLYTPTDTAAAVTPTTSQPSVGYTADGTPYLLVPQPGTTGQTQALPGQTVQPVSDATASAAYDSSAPAPAETAAQSEPAVEAQGGLLLGAALGAGAVLAHKKDTPKPAPQLIVVPAPAPTQVAAAATPVPPQAVAAVPTTPTVVGSGGIKVVTSTPISISNPISTINPSLGFTKSLGFGRRQ